LRLAAREGRSTKPRLAEIGKIEPAARRGVNFGQVSRVLDQIGSYPSGGNFAVDLGGSNLADNGLLRAADSADTDWIESS
jgi:hypothetical protein